MAQALPDFNGAFRHRDGSALSGSGLHERGCQRWRFEAGFEFSVLIQKLLTPLNVVFEHGLKFRSGGDLDNPFVELVGGPKSFRVPWSDFAEHAATMFLAKNFDHQIEVPAHDTN